MPVSHENQLQMMSMPRFWSYLLLLPCAVGGGGSVVNLARSSQAQGPFLCCDCELPEL